MLFAEAFFQAGLSAGATVEHGVLYFAEELGIVRSREDGPGPPERKEDVG